MRVSDITGSGNGAGGQVERRSGNRWLFALALIIAVGLIPGLIDLSSLLVNAGSDRPALERSRRAEALFRAALPKEGLKPPGVERRGQWSLRVTLPQGWEALPHADRARVVDRYSRLWTRCQFDAEVRPGDRATWLYLATDAGRIVGGWDPARGSHVDE